MRVAILAGEVGVDVFVVGAGRATEAEGMREQPLARGLALRVGSGQPARARQSRGDLLRGLNPLQTGRFDHGFVQALGQFQRAGHGGSPYEGSANRPRAILSRPRAVEKSASDGYFATLSRSASTSSQSLIHSVRSGSGSLARASALRTPARSASPFQ